VSAARLVVLGDALLDRDVEGDVHRLAPDAPVPVVDHERTIVRAGGAGLAATLAARGGHEVRLVTALADDPAGRELAGALADAGVEVVDVGLDGATPEKIRVRAQGRALLRLDRGGGTVAGVTAAARAAVEWADAVLVADYGRGMAGQAELRAALSTAIGRGVPVVWDPHPRGADPVPGVLLATPNAGEAGAGGADVARAVARAEALRAGWDARWVCVTRGAHGAVLAGPSGSPLAVAAPPGAGDRFATRATEVLAAGGSVPDAVRAAVAAASAFVAAGGASGGSGHAAIPASDAPDGTPAPSTAGRLAERVRAGGGVLVATGGCFDLLHPGHVHTLQAARALGDALVVCLNSDASVRSLGKGPGRPLVGQDDRAAVLGALSCVDAVEIFDEPTPAEALRRLRPDVWVKGGDYSGVALPEAEVLAEWGGRAIVVPFVEGRSTTRLIEEAALHAV
jgi:rfaE bifunctional protein nucleotidyltransferase chain/domain/rfaE bifunctional protein kinase chain/domain